MCSAWEKETYILVFIGSDSCPDMEVCGSNIMYEPLSFAQLQDILVWKIETLIVLKENHADFSTHQSLVMLIQMLHQKEVTGIFNKKASSDPVMTVNLLGACQYGVFY